MEVVQNPFPPLKICSHNAHKEVLMVTGIFFVFPDFVKADIFPMRQSRL